MDIPRGHAMLPLSEADFLDFIYNYYKAEYAPIRSIWSTATAVPYQPHRWIAIGHEFAPLSFRPANAQAQKDLESLDFFVRKWNLDANFVRGIVIRYAKYEHHERLEKKLYESYRADLMVRKALEEKHLIDSLWPSPAPRNSPQEHLAHGVQVRRWYGDMFAKYFKQLRAVDDFKLRPEVDARIKSSNVLMLVPFVDHLTFGRVQPIAPIVASGAAYSSAGSYRAQKTTTQAFGQPDRFDIRFDAPSDLTETAKRSVVRQCQCLKCGSKRDVTVSIWIDPSPGQTNMQNSQRRPSNPNISAPRKQHTSKSSQRYSPGYSLPSAAEQPPQQPARTDAENRSNVQEGRAFSSQQRKQCPRCTFLNHPDLTACEMCQGELPDTLTTKTTSPTSGIPSTPAKVDVESMPPPNGDVRRVRQELQRPAAPNRNSLSSSLFSIFPFSQLEQVDQQANPLPEQSASKPRQPRHGTHSKAQDVQAGVARHKDTQVRQPRPQRESTSTSPPHPASTSSANAEPSDAPATDQAPPRHSTPPSLRLSAHPEMAFLPMTPSPSHDHTSSSTTVHEGDGSSILRPAGMPQFLMDEYIPSPAPSPFPENMNEEDAGWGEARTQEEQRRQRKGHGDAGEGDNDEDEDEEEVVGRASREGMIDLDAVAREEIGVWGEERDE